MFNANNFIIDKVRRVTRVALDTGLVDFTATSIENPQVQFTGESTDKTDAQGVLIARFATAKGVDFSGASSMFSLGLLASQRGSEVQVASEDNKLAGETFEVLKVVNGKATMGHTPKVVPAVVYELSDDKNIKGTIDVGAEEGNAQISGKDITLPASFTGTQIGVLYEYETTSAVKMSDDAEKFATAGKYLVDILAADVCNPAIKRAGTLVFPKAMPDSNVSVDLTTEGNHPFSFSALKDYCADDMELCYILFNE